MASKLCVPEFGQCTAHTTSCCAPHRCYRQSQWFSQCGSACPADSTWDCSSTPPSIGLLVGRWGGWPPWTPLLIHTLRANPTVTFLLLSETPPAVPLPPNVEFHHWTLEALLERLQHTVGVRLRSLTTGGLLFERVSGAKVNDFKPMFGEAFSVELQRFDWWGYLQEDVLLGNLRALLTNARLAASDVICPFDSPLNSSGLFMMYRNAAPLARLWRLSRDAHRVLGWPTYQVFDEWWGAVKDGMPAVLGREAAAGRLRLSTGRAGRHLERAAPTQTSCAHPPTCARPEARSPPMPWQPRGWVRCDGSATTARTSWSSAGNVAASS